MSDESKELLEYARENYGWLGLLLTFVTLLWREPRAAFIRWWKTPSWKQVTAKAWETLATEVGAMRVSLESINRSFLEVRTQAAISTELSRIAIDESQVPRWETDEHGACVHANVALSKLFGMPQEEMLGFGWTKRIAPGHAEPSIRAFKQAYTDASYNYSHAYPIVVNDRLINIVARQVAELRGDDGKIIRMFGTCLPVEIHREQA